MEGRRRGRASERQVKRVQYIQRHGHGIGHELNGDARRAVRGARHGALSFLRALHGEEERQGPGGNN